MMQIQLLAIVAKSSLEMSKNSFHVLIVYVGTASYLLHAFNASCSLAKKFLKRAC
jgi:hypothetical protein